jgi:hypothetical protein
VTVSATCTVQQGRYWEWDVTVYDAQERIAKCTLGFIADVDTEDYTTRRVTPKTAALGAMTCCWLCTLNALSLILVLMIPVQITYMWHGWVSMLATETTLALGWFISRKGLLTQIRDWVTVRRSCKQH